MKSNSEDPKKNPERREHNRPNEIPGKRQSEQEKSPVITPMKQSRSSNKAAPIHRTAKVSM